MTALKCDLARHLLRLHLILAYFILQDYQISFTGRFNIYDLILDQPYFDSSYGAVSKEHMTLIKVSVAIFLIQK